MFYVTVMKPQIASGYIGFRSIQKKEIRKVPFSVSFWAYTKVYITPTTIMFDRTALRYLTKKYPDLCPPLIKKELWKPVLIGFPYHSTYLIIT